MGLRLTDYVPKGLAKIKVSEANPRLLRRTVVNCHCDSVCNVHLMVL